jgi:hypothetical protein
MSIHCRAVALAISSIESAVMPASSIVAIRSQSQQQAIERWLPQEHIQQPVRAGGAYPSRKNGRTTGVQECPCRRCPVSRTMVSAASLP